MCTTYEREELKMYPFRASAVGIYIWISKLHLFKLILDHYENIIIIIIIVN